MKNLPPLLILLTLIALLSNYSCKLNPEPVLYDTIPVVIVSFEYQYGIAEYFDFNYDSIVRINEPTNDSTFLTKTNDIINITVQGITYSVKMIGGNFEVEVDTIYPPIIDIIPPYDDPNIPNYYDTTYRHTVIPVNYVILEVARGNLKQQDTVKLNTNVYLNRAHNVYHEYFERTYEEFLKSPITFFWGENQKNVRSYARIKFGNLIDDDLPTDFYLVDLYPYWFENITNAELIYHIEHY